MGRKTSTQTNSGSQWCRNSQEYASLFFYHSVLFDYYVFAMMHRLSWESLYEKIFLWEEGSGMCAFHAFVCFAHVVF